MLLILIAVLAVFLAPRLIPRGPRGDLASGTLLVTGVSPRPDAGGQQYVTIAGIITGPTVNEYAVYQRMAVDVDQWPTVGQILVKYFRWCTRRRILTIGRLRPTGRLSVRRRVTLPRVGGPSP